MPDSVVDDKYKQELMLTLNTYCTVNSCIDIRSTDR